MTQEKILKKFLNIKNNDYCTTLKKGLLPFFYKALQSFAAKLKIIAQLFLLCQPYLLIFSNFPAIYVKSYSINNILIHLFYVFFNRNYISIETLTHSYYVTLIFLFKKTL